MDVLFLDEMLGKLCTIMRMLGHICIFIKPSPHHQNNPKILSVLSNKENIHVILITRNKKKIEKLSVYIKNNFGVDIDESIIIPYTSIKDQIIKVKDIVKYKARDPRCSVCGGDLIITSKEEVDKEKIPPKVLEYHNLFYYCPYCNKYYWKGKHWDNMRLYLGEQSFE